MATCQVPYPYEPDQISAIRASMSETRFETYLSKAGNHEQYAVALYLYNARLAKAFLFPLHVAEVTLRNAVDHVLVRCFGDRWHESADFRLHTLMPQGLAALDKAIERVGVGTERGQVIAALSFDFWSNLFRPDYGDLWRTNVNIALPNLGHGESRRKVQNLVKPINHFRNRVAHHEPVLDENVTTILSQIKELVSLRCYKTCNWMKHHSTVNIIIRTRPSRDNAECLLLKQKLDPSFLSVRPSSVLRDILNEIDDRHPVVVCVDDHDKPLCAFSTAIVPRYITKKAAQHGLIDLGEHTVGSLIRDMECGNRWTQLADNLPFALAIKALQKPGIQALVGVCPTTGKATGTILRAHRRY